MKSVFQLAHNVALNKLCKWRSVFAGWQLGTRADTDPECQAVRDQREALLILRTEVNALLKILLMKKLMTEDEWHRESAVEAEWLDRMLEQRFPGFTTDELGVRITDLAKAQETMKGWKP